jgi:prepilin-type N-terminal cleavage/methylation domain-containing protein
MYYGELNRDRVSAFKPLIGFTLAEVLITLGIIGIVAALTMPSLMANYQKKAAATRLKQTYSMLNQALLLS